MAVLDFDRSVWAQVLGESVAPRPDVLVLEGTWWRQVACDTRLGKLDAPQELAFPDMFIGTYDGLRVAYCCAYGAARAVEPAHIFAQLGTPLLVQIGTCGVMDETISPGMVAIPKSATAHDGVSPHYDAGSAVRFDPDLSDRAAAHLGSRGIETRHTRHLTWPSLFAQSDEMCRGWHGQGLQTVDMEASVVGAVAARFGAASVALLTTWDALSEGRTFLDPLEEAQQAALTRANAATFDIALELAREVADTTQT